LHQLQVGLHLLLHQWLYVGFFSLEDLFDLGLLIIGEIKLVQEHAQLATHHVPVHAGMHAVMHRSLITFALGKGDANGQCQSGGRDY
jgi:hypothetical protein